MMIFEIMILILIEWNVNACLLIRFSVHKGIYIEFLGKAHCEWTEGTGNRKETHTGTEVYLEERHYFAGSRTGKYFPIWLTIVSISFIFYFCTISIDSRHIIDNSEKRSRIIVRTSNDKKKIEHSDRYCIEILK